MTLSTTVGIPNGRIFPFAFGMYTLRTGCGSYFFARISSLISLPCSEKYALSIPTGILSIPGAPWFRSTARIAASMFSLSRILSISSTCCSSFCL